jgi:hypothetical protein
MVRDGVDSSVDVVEVELPNGAIVLARTAVVDGGGAEKVGWGDRFTFDDVSKAIEGVTDAVREALAKAAPDKVSVTLGFELAVKAGKLTALLVGGDAKASVAVTLEWDRAAAAGDG